MDPTVEKGLFVGYSETSKAFRIYISALQRVVVRRDVKFEEDRAFCRSRELDEREPSAGQQKQQSPSQVTGTQGTGGQGSGGTSMSLTGPLVSSSQVSVSGAQGTPHGAQTSSLDISQFSPLVGSTHGTSGSSGHPGTGTWLSCSVGQLVRAHCSDDEEFFDVPTPQVEVDSRKRKPKWLLETLKEAETVGVLKKQVRESRPPERFSSYVALVTNIVESEPSSYEEAALQIVWRGHGGGVCLHHEEQWVGGL